MDFLSPGWLWLLLAVPLPFLAAGGRRAPGHAAVRALLLALLALALARPAQVAEAGAGHHVFLLDRSASVPAEEQQRAVEQLRALRERVPEGGRSVLLQFGVAAGGEGAAETSAADVPAELSGFDETRVLPASSSGTALGDALRAAAAEIPDGEAGLVVLASDGHAAARNWGEAAADLSARGIPVEVLPLSAAEEEVRVVGLEPEGLLRQGHPARMLAVLDGGPAEVTVTLHRAGAEPATATATEGAAGEAAEVGEELARVGPLLVDGRTTVPLLFEPAEPGFLGLEVRVVAESGVNRRGEDDLMRRTVAVQEPLRVLYLGGRVQGGGEAMAAAAGPGFRFDQPADPTQVDPSDYPLVVVDDRPAEQVPESFQQELARTVAERGTGLLMSGGSGSFGPGGWFETTVSELLPVEFVQKEEKRDPSTTLCVIIDTSGSMGGNRVQLAKEVARLAISRLLPHDKVGIVEFYGAKRWAAPIQPASNRIELERALNRMDAGGGTVILPAIEEAFYGMQNVQTRYKHVLVLTDGGVETGPFEQMLRRMSDKGMNVSTVLIGPETHSEFLVNLANWGKGRFYNVPNRFNLPEIILKQPASAKLPAYRPGLHDVEGRGSAAWWGGTDPAEVPPVSGYVETRARDGAEVLLQTRDGGHPVFASWRYGLGRVSALTTEPAGPGTGSWSDWEGYGGFLSQTLTRTASGGAEPFRYELVRDGAWLRLTAERRLPGTLQPAAEWLSGATSEGGATPSAAAGAQPAVTFREYAPGRFEARLPCAPDVQARLRAGAAGVAGSATLLVSDAWADRAPELQVDPLAALELERLSAATGGGLSADEPLASRGGPALILRDFAPWLLLLALLGYLAEVWWRRSPGFQGGPA